MEYFVPGVGFVADDAAEREILLPGAAFLAEVVAVVGSPSLTPTVGAGTFTGVLSIFTRDTRLQPTTA